MNQAPRQLGNLSEKDLMEVLALNSNPGFITLVDTLKKEFNITTENLKNIGNPEWDTIRLANWRGQAYVLSILTGISDIIEKEVVFREAQGETLAREFHNPHPSTLRDKKRV